MRREVLGGALLMLAGALLVADRFVDQDPGLGTAIHRDDGSAADVQRSLGQHDFGTLVGAVVEEHEFRVLNEEPDTWSVVDTSQDCGCVNVVFASNLVEPGQELVLRVRMETAGQPHGPLEKHVYAWVEPGSVRWTGTVTAHLIPSAHARPGVVELELPRGERSFRGGARLCVPALGPPPAVSVQGTPAVLVRVDPPVRAGDLFEFPVSFDGELPADRELLRETVRFVVSAGASTERAETVPIAIVVHRRRQLVVSPQALYIEARSGVPAAGAIHVKDASGRLPEELDWRAEPAGAMTVDWDGERGILRVAIADPAGLASSARLVLTARDGETVVVPVVCSTPIEAKAVGRR